MSNVPKHRQLPLKEAGLFKTLLSQYETRQYKKGVKAADQILKKFPNHGETLAIKALTIHASLPSPATVSSLPKEEEAEAMARLAVKKDITSHITWHVLGLIAKGKKDWAEASKAFGQARKIDPDNIPLLRDYISLSLHVRNYSQALAARHHFVCIRPNLRQNWIGLMINHQLIGDVDEAIKVADSLANVSQTDGLNTVERSQLILHGIQLLKQANRPEDALAKLEAAVTDKAIPARGEILLLRAGLLSDLGRKEEAEDVYRTLLEQNPDSLANYRGFLRNKGLSLDGSEADKVLKTLAGFTESYPRSAAPKRMALNVASGETFRDLATKYIVAGLERGVPSLFVDIKSLYENGDKMAVVGEIVEDVVSKLEAESSLHGDDTVPPPTTLLWAYYFLALHLAHPRNPAPEHIRALDLLDKAIKHTPTLPELYMARAMVLKRAGDAFSAAREMEIARALDGQDRYVNGKAGKYLMRAGQGDKAVEIMGLFTKKDAVSPVQDLTDLQCLWFLQEQGDMYLRAGNFGMALKRYHTTVQVFQDYEDDQWDFHSYCLRKMTISAYVDLMRYEDQLRSHPGFFKAVLSALAIYIKISDDPSLLEETITPEEEAERKKAAKKAQKAEQKAKKAALSSGEGSKAGEQPAPDPDPTGQTLLRTETPLDDAIKLWKQLERMAASRVEIWVAGYELFIRKKQYLLALKALCHAVAIDSQVPDLHRQIIHFKKTIDGADLPEAVNQTIKEVLPTILPSEQSTSAFNAAFIQAHPTSPDHVFAGARGLAEELTQPGQSSKQLPSESKEHVAALLNQLLDEKVRPDVLIFTRAEAFMRDGLGLDVEQFRKGVRARLPLAWSFASVQEVKERVLSWDEQDKKEKEEMGIN